MMIRFAAIEIDDIAGFTTDQIANFNQRNIEQFTTSQIQVH
jgi:hypothetical protein